MADDPRAGNADRVIRAHGDDVPGDHYYDDPESADPGQPLSDAHDFPDAGDLAKADWHLRIAQYWLRIEESEGAAVAEVIAEISDRWKARQEALQNRAGRHLTVLEHWHRQEVGRGRSAKTLSLPSGTVQLKKPPRPQFVIDDADRLRVSLAALTTAEGESVEELAYPTVEKPFSIQALERAISCRPTGKDRGEVGSRYELRDPDTGAVIEGAHYTEIPDQWSAK